LAPVILNTFVTKRHK